MIIGLSIASPVAFAARATKLLVAPSVRPAVRDTAPPDATVTFEEPDALE
jgi:hypothetical protein